MGMSPPVEEFPASASILHFRSTVLSSVCLSIEALRKKNMTEIIKDSVTEIETYQALLYVGLMRGIYVYEISIINKFRK